jgi:phenylalanine-4-hydroxylase
VDPSRDESGPDFRGDEVELVHLDRDHPGFSDPVYRRRRDEIARLARGYRAGGPLPAVEYREDEHQVWRTVWRELEPLHRARACRAYREGTERFGFDRNAIPSFAEVNARLSTLEGFALAPVAGLVQPGLFLEQLAQRRFLATQYMRHGSTPLYTPEPDVVHEYIGHVGALAHPGLAELNVAFGHAASRAHDPARIEALIRVYWYTLEFGILEEDGRIAVYGAGILSSFGELGRFETEARLRPWDLEEIVATPYDPTDYQRVLFVAPPMERLRSELLQWLARI